MKKLSRLLSGAAAFALPALAFAQTTDVGVQLDTTDAFDLMGTVSQIFGILIPILVTFAVIYIIVGVIKYATASDDETQASARKSILHGIIALFVIVSIWGLVAILNSTFNIGQNGENLGVCQEVWVPNDEPPYYGEFVVPPGC